MPKKKEGPNSRLPVPLGSQGRIPNTYTDTSPLQARRIPDRREKPTRVGFASRMINAERKAYLLASTTAVVYAGIKTLDLETTIGAALLLGMSNLAPRGKFILSKWGLAALTVGAANQDLGFGIGVGGGAITLDWLIMTAMSYRSELRQFEENSKKDDEGGGIDIHPH